MSEPEPGVSPGSGVTGLLVFAVFVLGAATVVALTGGALAFAIGAGAGGGAGRDSGAGRAAPSAAGAATSSTAYIGGEDFGAPAIDNSTASTAPAWITIVPVTPAQKAPLGSRSARALSGRSPLLRS